MGKKKLTWTPLDPVAEALTRLSQAINAAFRGRSQSLPVSTFVGDARFILATDSLTVDFTDNSTAPGSSIASWLWDFGDSQTSTSQNPTHVYATAGTYLVGLTIVTAEGFVGQAFETVTVSEDEPDDADPIANFTHAEVGLTSTFTDTSTDADGTIASWSWVFGEGQPTADFTTSVNNLTVTFTDASTDVAPGTISTRSWDFGDGSTSTSTNPVHAYASAGGYNVTLTVTDSDGNSASVSKTVSVTTGATLGIPFGPFDLWSTSYSAPNVPVAMFSLSQDAYSPTGLPTRINAARALGHKLVLMLTNGNHSNYVTKVSGVSNFDFDKWKAKLDTYNTPTLQSAIATAVADGTVQGYDMLDEPQSGNWGPVGHITKQRIDSMATYAKAIFTTLPCGLSVKPDYLKGSFNYQHVDFITTQYIQAFGDVTTWKNKAIADATPDKVAIVFSMNILSGGAGFHMTSCPAPSGGSSPAVPTGPDARCSMGSQQIKDYGLILGPAGAGLMLWKYDTNYMANSANSASFRSVAAALALLPQKSWRRTT